MGVNIKKEKDKLHRANLGNFLRGNNGLGDVLELLDHSVNGSVDTWDVKAWRNGANGNEKGTQHTAAEIHGVHTSSDRFAAWNVS